MRRHIFHITLIVALVLLLMPAAAQAMTFDQAVDKLVKSGWAQRMEDQCVSFKGNPMGFRAGGTPSDDACARWIARQMKASGLMDVRLEAVPVDEWDFKGATVSVSGDGYPVPATYVASSFGGVVGTPAAGVTGDVVYVGSGSTAEFLAAGDVSGKIVLIDFDSAMWWMSYPAMEAGVQGAAATILTYDADKPGYFGQPEALACFDAETDLSSPPMVWIPWSAGDELKAALASDGVVTATIRNNVNLRLADDGGEGYNVVGIIPGTTNKNQYIVFGGHHDSWFEGGLDNASSVVNQLVIARAMKMSNYKPQRNLVFLSTTAEEYGFANSYYDWCIGAWQFITERHPGWAGRIAGMLNAEILGHKDGNLWMLASPELQPMLNDKIADSPELTTWKGTPAAVIGDTWCWNDQWTFTAAGVPSVSFWSQDNAYSGVYKTTIYHSQYDTPALIDWTFFANLVKYQFRVAREFDGGLLPYALSERPTHLRAALETEVFSGEGVTVEEVIADSVDAQVWADFRAAEDRFGDASSEFDSLAANDLLPHANLAATNAGLMKIEKIVNTNFTALNWLDYTTYPFDQTARDIYAMESAWAALADGPDYDTAAAWVSSVGLMWYGINFSEPVFARELQRHRESFYRICWGAQGHLAKYQNLMPDYRAVLAHDEATAMDLLDGRIAYQQAELQARIIQMTGALEAAADQIEDLFPVR